MQATLFEAFALHVYENLARSPKNFPGLARLQLLIRFLSGERPRKRTHTSTVMVDALRNRSSLLDELPAGVAERNIY
jgi:hypothetical protein